MKYNSFTPSCSLLDLLNDLLVLLFQVRGHHIAKLDPLGISCVNFDDAPVTVSSNVGEN